MLTTLGLVIVFAGIFGGYVWAGGPLHVLLQPAELAIIGGAAAGTLLIAAPGRMRVRLFAALGKAFRGAAPTKADYVDLLKLQYEVFSFMRKHGAILLEDHLRDLRASAIFGKYPSFLSRRGAVDFFRDALQQIVNGTASADELDVLLDTEIETHHEEAAIPVSLIQRTGDSLPGLGIVAAVLGIVITMGSLDAAPKEIGHNVGAALVGTFLGILLCYGVFQPMATNIELQEIAYGRYLRCIKEGVVASLRGTPPMLVVEFARRAIFSDERPSAAETDAACRAVKSALA
jgi:chemotaxis protein MotA